MRLPLSKFSVIAIDKIAVIAIDKIAIDKIATGFSFPSFLTFFYSPLRLAFRGS